jgi:hypothetical protein
MAGLRVKGAIGACIAASLMFSSTAAAAATVPGQQVNPWGVLTAMSGGASAAALCGTAVAATATQAPGGCVLPVMDAPAPPPAPAAPTVVPAVEPVPGGGGISPLVFGLLALAAAVGIYLAVHHRGHANSPA